MGIFQQFPYSNFHEMNLDQIIKIMREMQDEWENTKTEWASYKEFIDNYFENLDVSDEIRTVLYAMAADGTLNNISNPIIIQTVTDWLAAHVLTPTTPALDKTLLLANAAAESESVGIEFKKRDTYLAINKNLNDLMKLTNVYSGYVGSSALGSTNAARSMWFPCAPRQKMTISKNTVTARFRVGCITQTPADTVPVTNYVENDAGTSITYTTSDTAKYVIIFFWSSTDTLSIADIASEIQVNTEVYGDQDYYNDNVYSKRYQRALAEGLYRSRELIEMPMTITGSNKWDLNTPTDKHIFLKVTAGDTVSVITGTSATRIAFTITNHAIKGALTDAISQYVVPARTGTSWEVPAGAEYVYVATHSSSDIMPYRIEINGVDVVKSDPESSNLSTVFFEDFDNSESLNLFHPIVADPADATRYTSVFNDAQDLFYLDSGCVNLKVRALLPGESIPLGTNTDGVARNKISAYISTDEQFAMRQGKVSARIKCSAPVGSGIPWCFWLFSQNGDWAAAPEYDIIESVFDFINAPVTAGGNTYPTGSAQEILWSNTHYSNNGNTAKTFYYDIQYAAKTGSHSWAAFDEVYTKGFNSDDWHVYSCEFTDEYIIYKIDDIISSVVDITSLTNTTDWDLPKDIRFNIKSAEYSTNNTQVLSIDWLKIETANVTPVTSIDYNDITMYVGETIYVDPDFNTDCTNCAYTMSTTDTSIISITQYETAGYVASHKITALAAGTASVLLETPNGGYSKTFTITVTP